MEKIVLCTGNLCVVCLSEMTSSDLLPFPLHHLTSKMGINLEIVFEDMIVKGNRHPYLDRMEVWANACGRCVDLCEELLYKFTDNAGTQNCFKSLLEKMDKVEVEEGFRNCESQVARFYSGFVDKLRKGIMEKLRSEPQLGMGTGIYNLLNIRDDPVLFRKICSYLSLKEMKNCSAVCKDMRRLVFPSLMDASIITFENQSQLPAITAFIKAKSNDFKKNVNLFIKSWSFDDSLESRSALLQLFQKCGTYIGHLRLSYELAYLGDELVNGFRDNNSIPVLGCGKELLPSLRRVEIYYVEEGYEGDDDNNQEEVDCRKEQIKASLPFMKAVLENSPKLSELKVTNYHFHMSTPLFQLIGESAQRIDTLETKNILLDDSLSYLHSLRLKRVDFETGFDSNVPQAMTNFLASQSKSLEDLRLWIDFDFVHFTFPRMESLEAYRLSATEVRNTGNLGAVSFHTQLPKLKELRLNYVNEDYFPTLFPLGAEPAASVKVLRLLQTKYEKDNLMKAVGAFKCLSKLEIPVASNLPDCWMNLTGLQELTLHSIGYKDPNQKKYCFDKYFLDQIITGLNIHYDSFATDEQILKYEEKYEQMETKKSLGLLTKLRLLRFRRALGCKDQSLMLSDISCRLVLMKMESLEHIEFWGFSPPFIGTSRKVLDELGGKVDLYFVNPMDLKIRGWGPKLGWDLKFE